ncbi:MAG: OmpH family outer membrane protein [Proteobacteria bacterium]|nr:OmpH family outer membrane protein [Pseudomonadota bacterium]
MRIYMTCVMALCSVWVMPEAYGHSLSEKHFGIVNNQKIITSIPEGIKARGDLEEYVKAKQKELRQKKEGLDTFAKEMERKASIWNDEVKKAKTQEFQTRLMQLRQDEQALQADVMGREREATRKIVEKISLTVKKLAESKKLFLVYETSTSGIVYMKEYVDLTDEVILELSKTPTTLEEGS